MGLKENGEISSSKSPDNVSWFNEGPTPGLIGSSIINGHSGWKDGIPAVFDKLKNLEKNDMVYIKNESGEVMTFIVTKLKIYHKDDIALDVFNSSDDKAHLNLITCIGTWNISQGDHDDRIVVFTDLF